MSKMELERVVFERGIAATRAADGRWRLQAALKGYDEAFANPASIAARFNVRPIVIFQRMDGRPASGLLLQPDAERPFLNLLVSDIMQNATRCGPILIHDLLLLQYLAGAVVYHCTELAIQYAAVCRDFSTIMPILEKPSEFSTFGYQAEGYYEFDSLISASRRAYDALRGPLWKGSGCKDSLPRSLPSLLKKRKVLTPRLIDMVAKSWSTVGVEVTAYRDCQHHYTSTDFALSSASMQLVDGGVATVHFRIPDNPEARSQRSFVFAGNKDALRFGWTVATEVVTLCAMMSETLASASTGVAPTHRPTA